MPVGLWCRGPLRLDEAPEQAVAVVGSRSATTYGGGVAGDIARRAGAGVAGPWSPGPPSGSTRPRTAAPSPAVDPPWRCWRAAPTAPIPSAHRALIDYIADVGLVVSEAAPGCAPTRIRFLARNRLIAAMARGTVVVEAAVRSGALEHRELGGRARPDASWVSQAR